MKTCSRKTEDRLVVVRIGRGWTLLRVEEGQLRTIATLPVPKTAIVRRDPLGRWWALDEKSRHVWGFQWEGDDLPPLGTWTLPRGLEPKDVTAGEGRLFVGGVIRWDERLNETHGSRAAPR